MNWDEELEAVQANMDERQRLWRSAQAAAILGPAFAKYWYDGLTPDEQVLFQEVLDEQMARILAFVEGVRQAFVELGKQLVSGLEAFEAFGIAADDLQKRRCYDVRARRLYWDGRKIERVGRYRPYRSRKDRRSP